MKNADSLFIAFLFVVFGANALQHGKPKDRDSALKTSIKSSFITRTSKVTLSVRLKHDTIKYGQAIAITIAITNNTGKTQTLLFDKPELWGLSGNVTDLNTGQSVVSYHNKAVLSSQVYAEEDLKRYYYHLKPGVSLSAESNLQHIVIFNTADYNLPKGRYEMELSYGSSTSNKVVFWVD